MPRDFDKTPMENGMQIVCREDGIHENMLMDITVYQLEKGSSKEFLLPTKETAVHLFAGDVTFQWEGQSAEATRTWIFDLKSYTLHVCKGVQVVVTANTDSEIMVISTTNDRTFASKLYTPDDLITGTTFPDKWDGAARRDVSTVFDYDNAPYSNLVVGEVINARGRWAGYIPHIHPQPELYYYRMDHPNGFGAAFIGDDVYKITDRSFSAIPTNKSHPTVAAPGYRLGYIWVIRHLDGNPWLKTRNDEPAHEWLLDVE
ncbi:5-deoxy-glucuronate isomerase [Oscillospiraceae bacterium MB08-C2-2]|nr:5-deoxy-glucuronate isomerase [Oscillospiraceae bacterium MB08-C2-2]